MRSKPPSKIDTSDISQSSRGVAEMVQFTLILGVTTAVIFAGLYMGLAHLSSVSDSQDLNAAAGEMSQAQEAQSEVAQGTPHKVTRIGLRGGRLAYGESNEVEMSVRIISNTGTQDISGTIQPLFLEFENGKVALENSGVIISSEERGGDDMARSPAFLISDSQTIIKLFATERDGGVAQVSGGDDATAAVSLLRISQTAIQSNPLEADGSQDTATVEIEIQSPRYEAWANYFELHDHDMTVSENPGSNTVEVSFETEQVVAQKIEMGVRIG
jgi:hypothetical protein